MTRSCPSARQTPSACAWYPLLRQVLPNVHVYTTVDYLREPLLRRPYRCFSKRSKHVAGRAACLLRPGNVRLWLKARGSRAPILMHCRLRKGQATTTVELCAHARRVEVKYNKSAHVPTVLAPNDVQRYSQITSLAFHCFPKSEHMEAAIKG